MAYLQAPCGRLYLLTFRVFMSIINQVTRFKKQPNLFTSGGKLHAETVFARVAVDSLV